jgi:hypothetical protein
VDRCWRCKPIRLVGTRTDEQDARALAAAREAEEAARLEALRRQEEAQRLAQEEQERKEEAARAREAAAAKPAVRGKGLPTRGASTRGRGISSLHHFGITADRQDRVYLHLPHGQFPVVNHLQAFDKRLPDLAWLANTQMSRVVGMVHHAKRHSAAR